MTPEEYAAKRDARYERLVRAADRAQRDGDASLKQGDQMFSIIPLGQPILIGHYSEHRDRRYRERARNKIGKGYALHEKAAALRSRAESVQKNDAIFSDDPQAQEKIEEKIARLEARQTLMKAANKLVRKNDRVGLTTLGFSDKAIDRLFTPDFCGRLGYADYEITNNGANIRRLKKRVVVIEKHAADETSETLICGIKVVDNVEMNRVQIYLNGKPPDAVRDDLNRNGFHFSKYEGNAWQRMRSAWAMNEARRIIEKHYSRAAEAVA